LILRTKSPHLISTLLYDLFSSQAPKKRTQGRKRQAPEPEVDDIAFHILGSQEHYELEEEDEEEDRPVPVKNLPLIAVDDEALREVEAEIVKFQRVAENLRRRQLSTSGNQEAPSSTNPRYGQQSSGSTDQRDGMQNTGRQIEIAEGPGGSSRTTDQTQAANPSQRRDNISENNLVVSSSQRESGDKSQRDCITSLPSIPVREGDTRADRHIPADFRQESGTKSVRSSSVESRYERRRSPSPVRHDDRHEHRDRRDSYYDVRDRRDNRDVRPRDEDHYHRERKDYSDRSPYYSQRNRSRSPPTRVQATQPQLSTEDVIAIAAETFQTITTQPKKTESRNVINSGFIKPAPSFPRPNKFTIPKPFRSDEDESTRDNTDDNLTHRVMQFSSNQGGPTLSVTTKKDDGMPTHNPPHLVDFFTDQEKTDAVQACYNRAVAFSNRKLLLKSKSKES